jgi:hypothetical protein
MIVMLQMSNDQDSSSLFDNFLKSLKGIENRYNQSKFDKTIHHRNSGRSYKNVRASVISDRNFNNYNEIHRDHDFKP